MMCLAKPHNGNQNSCSQPTNLLVFLLHTNKLKILQIILWNIGMAKKAKETRSGCLVHIVQ